MYKNMQKCFTPDTISGTLIAYPPNVQSYEDVGKPFWILCQWENGNSCISIVVSMSCAIFTYTIIIQV